MKLYHGTYEANLDSILKHGLRPRGKKSGNWKHTVESNSKAVYLTNAYVFHFAQSAKKHRDGKLVVLEIDCNMLNPFLFAPDEYFLEQATRKDQQFVQGDMVKRTRWFRKHALTNFQLAWKQSLEGMGTCCYHGNIPPEAITRYATVSADASIILLSDPCITPLNYAIMGGFYRDMVHKIFDDPCNEKYDECFASYHENLKKVPREGIEVKTP